MLLQKDRVSVRNRYFEELEEVHPYHFNGVRGVFEILKVITESLNNLFIFKRSLLVILDYPGHY